MRNEQILVPMEDSNDDDLDFVMLVAVVVVVLVEESTWGSSTRKKTVLCSRTSGVAVLARTGIGKNMTLRRGQHLTRRGRRRLEYLSHGDARDRRGEDREYLETATKKSCRKSRRREGFTVIAEEGERSRMRVGEPAKGEDIEGAVGWNDRRPGRGRGGRRRVGYGALGGISSIWRGDWSSTRYCDVLGGAIMLL